MVNRKQIQCGLLSNSGNWY